MPESCNSGVGLKDSGLAAPLVEVCYLSRFCKFELLA